MILLKNETDLLVAQCRSLFWFQMMRCSSVEKVFTGPAVIVHSQNVQQRRFACAGRTHDRDEVAFLNLQIDLAQNVKELFLRQRMSRSTWIGCAPSATRTPISVVRCETEYAITP